MAWLSLLDRFLSHSRLAVYFLSFAPFFPDIHILLLLLLFWHFGKQLCSVFRLFWYLFACLWTVFFLVSLWSHFHSGLFAVFRRSFCVAVFFLHPFVLRLLASHFAKLSFSCLLHSCTQVGTLFVQCGELLRTCLQLTAMRYTHTFVHCNIATIFAYFYGCSLHRYASHFRQRVHDILV